MSSTLFRRGTLGDADGVAQVWVRSWQEAYRDLLTPEEIAERTVEMRRAHWTDAFSEERTSLWVAEVDDRIVGFLIARPSPDEDLDAARMGEVSALYLVAAAHGRGVGAGLMERALDDLRAAGFGDVALWVLDGNSPAIGFYEHTGWAFDGGRKDCFGGADAPALRYRRTLH
jgi:GNAT superfamily N-acetyltransferase